MKATFQLSLIVSLLLFAIPANAQSKFVINSVLDKVVMIIALDEHYQPLGIGSGFMVGDEGQIATNYHVIEGASSAIVKFVNKEEKFTVNKIIHKSPRYDIAVIKVSATTTPLVLGDDKLSSIGDRILAVGNPEGLEGTVSEGIISGFRKIEENFRLMQITAPVSPGSSGGPVINRHGYVLAIASASYISGQNLNFAIPVSKLLEVISGKKDNLDFGLKSLPRSESFNLGDYSKNTSLIKVLNLYTYPSVFGGAKIKFSIQNNLKRDIRNIKLLIIWRKNHENIHFSALLIKDIIPSYQAKIIEKRDERVSHGWTDPGPLGRGYDYKVRIIDYEILPTSGAFEFK